MSARRRERNRPRFRQEQDVRVAGQKGDAYATILKLTGTSAMVKYWDRTDPGYVPVASLRPYQESTRHVSGKR